MFQQTGLAQVREIVWKDFSQKNEAKELHVW